MEQHVLHTHDPLLLQDQLLPGVSRTFALTIPQLPPPLRMAVTNAYLLCRIADTVEDDLALTGDQKREFHQRFVEVVEGRHNGGEFAADLAPLLSDATPEAEQLLIQQVPGVIQVTHDLNPRQRAALERCVAIMCAGMPKFQENKSVSGLPTVADMDQYCYYVAGVVGEMLTELFCDYCGTPSSRRQPMMRLAVAFGQGLQMTNILKDFWEDRASQACWLPREVFQRNGLDLGQPDLAQPPFFRGIRELIGMAHGHLQEALSYVRMIPSGEVGIRRFCLWAIGLAVLTLQGIRKNPHYTSADQIKVSRRALKTVVLISNLLSSSDRALRLAFKFSAMGLPLQRHLIAARSG